MRFGCCGSQVYTKADKIGAERVDALAKYGYDYIELPIAEMLAVSDEEYAALKAQVQASGIKCEVCNNLFPASIRLTGPDVDMEKVEEHYNKALARAADIGASVVVFGSGGAKKVPDGFPIEQAWQQVLAITKGIAPVAQKHGITIAIEPIRQKECNIITSFAEGVAMAKQVNHPSVKVLIDLLHMHDENEPLSNLLENGEWLSHVHLSFPSTDYEGDRTFPTDMAEFDYQSFIDVLHKINYQGHVSVEAPSTDFDVQAPKAVALMKGNF